jgi:DNA-3-methyladenine glycosylase II
VVVFVELPQPFDFGLTLERFRSFGDDPVNRFVDGALHRAFGGREVRLAETSGGVLVSPDDEALADAVRRFLGLGFDLAGFEHFAAAEPVLARVVGRLRGLRPALVPDPFEMLVTAITSQQVSLHAALAIRRRFVERFGRRLDVAYAFPERETVATARSEELVEVGFSRRKADYVLALAGSRIDLGGLAELPDEDVVMRLTALPGIGRWTAEWYLARHLGRPDVWPAGDLGLRKAVAVFFLGNRQVGEAEVRDVGAAFSPWRTLVAQYLLVASRVAPPADVLPEAVE